VSDPHWPRPGAVRVAANPTALPDHRRGVNRFDDPQGQFLVRYLADTHRGCLIELLARFRPDATAEARIASVSGVEDPADGAHPGPAAVQDWLSKQHVAHCRLDDPTGAVLVPVNDAVLLARLNNHPAVRTALNTAVKVGACPPPGELDGGTIRLSGTVGRAITQAVSRALYEEDPRPTALAYRSRLDDEETCWALYDHARVTFTNPIKLQATFPEHLRAVRAAAVLYAIELPAPWR
jgi:hypothetical protein